MPDPTPSQALAAVEAALRAAAAAGLWPRAARILVAASGGPDSTALLHALATLGPGLGVASVVAAHVDHGLRPSSAADGEAVAALAARLGLEFVGTRVRVEGPGGIQAAARRARYRALETLRREAGADRVATGHTATDQAETLLLRLGRGTSPARASAPAGTG
jgi:tRNA(Ile)-lysidine synthase